MTTCLVGPRDPRWGALPSQGCRHQSPCVLVLQPRQGKRDRTGGALPGVRLSWGGHACAQHTGASFRRTEMPVTGGPREEASETPLGVGGGQRGFTFGRAGGRESGKSDSTWAGPTCWPAWGRRGRGQGCGKPRTAWGRRRTGVSPATEPAALGGGAQRGLGARASGRSGGGRMAQSLPSARNLGRLLGGEGP